MFFIHLTKNKGKVYMTNNELLVVKTDTISLQLEPLKKILAVLRNNLQSKGICL